MTRKLVKSYDSCIKTALILTESIDKDLVRYLSSQDNRRKDWIKECQEISSLRQSYTKIKAEKEALEMKLKHVRNQLGVEVKRRLQAETAQDHLERQIGLIRDLLLNDPECMGQLTENERNALLQLSQMRQSIGRASGAFEQATDSLLSPSDIDNTMDERSEYRSRYQDKRMSKPKRSMNAIIEEESKAHLYSDKQDSPPKRVRTDKVQDAVSAVANAMVSPQKMRCYLGPDESDQHAVDGPVPHAATGTKSTVQASAPVMTCNTSPLGMGQGSQVHPGIKTTSTPASTPLASQYGAPASAPPMGTPVYTQLSAVSLYPKLSPPTPGLKRTYLSQPAVLPKPKAHNYTSKSIMKPETCCVCKKKVGFGKTLLKCQDCSLKCHPDCKDLVAQSCDEKASTPKGIQNSLELLAPVTRPRVPKFVTDCLSEIEKRGLCEVGLYRISGSEREVKDLKERVLKGRPVDLSGVRDIHVVTGVLKDFLRNLSEPLITYNLHAAFCSATASYQPTSSLYQVIQELPTANRDTLAVLMGHLQVVSQTKTCRMDASNLARVFGPTLVGHNCPNPDHNTMLSDLKIQPKVIELLLSLPSEYWAQFVNHHASYRTPPLNPNFMFRDATPATPEAMPVVETYLGPVDAAQPTSGPISADKMSVTGLGKTPITPRFGVGKLGSNRGGFFQSPIV